MKVYILLWAIIGIQSIKSQNSTVSLNLSKVNVQYFTSENQSSDNYKRVLYTVKPGFNVNEVYDSGVDVYKVPDGDVLKSADVYFREFLPQLVQLNLTHSGQDSSLYFKRENGSFTSVEEDAFKELVKSDSFVNKTLVLDLDRGFNNKPFKSSKVTLFSGQYDEFTLKDGLELLKVTKGSETLVNPSDGQTFVRLVRYKSSTKPTVLQVVFLSVNKVETSSYFELEYGEWKPVNLDRVKELYENHVPTEADTTSTQPGKDSTLDLDLSDEDHPVGQSGNTSDAEEGSNSREDTPTPKEQETDSEKPSGEEEQEEGDSAQDQGTEDRETKEESEPRDDVSGEQEAQVTEDSLSPKQSSAEEGPKQDEEADDEEEVQEDEKTHLNEERKTSDQTEGDNNQQELGVKQDESLKEDTELDDEEEVEEKGEEDQEKTQASLASDDGGKEEEAGKLSEVQHTPVGSGLSPQEPGGSEPSTSGKPVASEEVSVPDVEAGLGSKEPEVQEQKQDDKSKSELGSQEPLSSPSPLLPSSLPQESQVSSADAEDTDQEVKEETGKGDAEERQEEDVEETVEDEGEKEQEKSKVDEPELPKKPESLEEKVDTLEDVSKPAGLEGTEAGLSSGDSLGSEEPIIPKEPAGPEPPISGESPVLESEVPVSSVPLGSSLQEESTDHSVGEVRAEQLESEPRDEVSGGKGEEAPSSQVGLTPVQEVSSSPGQEEPTAQEVSSSQGPGVEPLPVQEEGNQSEQTQDSTLSGKPTQEVEIEPLVMPHQAQGHQQQPQPQQGAESSSVQEGKPSVETQEDKGEESDDDLGTMEEIIDKYFKPSEELEGAEAQDEEEKEKSQSEPQKPLTPVPAETGSDADSEEEGVNQKLLEKLRQARKNLTMDDIHEALKQDDSRDRFVNIGLDPSELSTREQSDEDEGTRKLRRKRRSRRSAGARDQQTEESDEEEGEETLRSISPHDPRKRIDAGIMDQLAQQDVSGLLADREASQSSGFQRPSSIGLDLEAPDDPTNFSVQTWDSENGLVTKNYFSKVHDLTSVKYKDFKWEAEEDPREKKCDNVTATFLNGELAALKLVIGLSDFFTLNKFYNVKTKESLNNTSYNTLVRDLNQKAQSQPQPQGQSQAQSQSHQTSHDLTSVKPVVLDLDLDQQEHVEAQVVKTDHKHPYTVFRPEQGYGFTGVMFNKKPLWEANAKYPYASEATLYSQLNLPAYLYLVTPTSSSFEKSLTFDLVQRCLTKKLEKDQLKHLLEVGDGQYHPRFDLSNPILHEYYKVKRSQYKEFILRSFSVKFGRVVAVFDNRDCITPTNVVPFMHFDVYYYKHLPVYLVTDPGLSPRYFVRAGRGWSTSYALDLDDDLQRAKSLIDGAVLSSEEPLTLDFERPEKGKYIIESWKKDEVFYRTFMAAANHIIKQINCNEAAVLDESSGKTAAGVKFYLKRGTPYKAELLLNTPRGKKLVFKVFLERERKLWAEVDEDKFTNY